MTNKNRVTIAIDGPVGSGKGTLAVALSKRLGFIYLYTGGMYRALTLACLRANIDLKDEDKVLTILGVCDLHLSVTDGATKIFLRDEDVTEKIVFPQISNATPVVAAHPRVREEMVTRQKAIVAGHSAVIEGRDIATVVAPNADLKIFLTADLQERAKRRFQQFEKLGINKTLEEVLQDTKDRDKKDSDRTISPLGKADNAVVIDTTGDTIDQTIEKVLVLLQERHLYDQH